MKKFIFFSTFLAGLLGLITYGSIVYAHSGGTDKYGCHVCKTNCKKYGLKTNQYHCHKNDSKKTVYTPQTTYSCTGRDLDCKDFGNHSEAQKFFDRCRFSKTYDPMRLDADNDSIACED